MWTLVDASVAVKWYLPEPGERAAMRVLAEGIAGSRELLAPDWIVAEVANALRKKVKREECGELEAQVILEAFETDTPELIESVPLAPRALELALRLDESVYDCLYVAAAIESEAALVTADARLARAASSPRSSCSPERPRPPARYPRVRAPVAQRNRAAAF